MLTIQTHERESILIKVNDGSVKFKSVSCGILVLNFDTEFKHGLFFGHQSSSLHLCGFVSQYNQGLLLKIDGHRFHRISLTTFKFNLSQVQNCTV